MKEFNLLKKFNWQEASKPSIKKYVADLRQADEEAPVALTLFNDTDVAFSYEYLDPGTYLVTMSKPLFVNCGMGCPSQKTQVIISNSTYVNDAAGPSGYSITIFPVSNDAMIILTTDLSGSADNVLGNNSQNAIELTIYN